MRLLASLAAGVVVAVSQIIPAHATHYYVKLEYAKFGDGWIATYTDDGKNCESGRAVLYEDQGRAGVTCIRSKYHMDVYRFGASDLFDVPPYTEVRIPSGGADVYIYSVAV